MEYEFRWNSHNIDHIAEHGMSIEEVEFLIRRMRPPFPSKLGNRKYIAQGQLMDGTFAQAIFLVADDETLYVIHARPLTDSEKRKFRRRRR